MIGVVGRLFPLVPTDTDVTHASPRSRNAATVAELKERPTRLDAHCLTDLVSGMDAFHAGDLPFEVVPVTSPITDASATGDVAELVDLFNAVLDKAQTAIAGYNAFWAQLQGALDDESATRPPGWPPSP